MNTEHPHSGSLEQHNIGGGENDVNNEVNSPGAGGSDDDGYEKKPSDVEKKSGRRKINIEFIEDKSRRHITFSKRKAGIMKKAYELSTLTGTQVLLLVASETGHVYTFATPKLQPLITKPEGKNLIQSCLNAPEVTAVSAHTVHNTHRPPIYPEQPPLIPGSGGYGQPDIRETSLEASVYDDDKKEPKSYPGMDLNSPYNSAAYPPPSLVSPYMQPMAASLPRGYPGMPPQYPTPHSQYQTSSTVQGNYQQSQQGYPSSAYGTGMHNLPQWNKAAGMQSIPMNPGMGAQEQGSQVSSASLSGLIQASKQQTDHT